MNRMIVFFLIRAEVLLTVLGLLCLVSLNASAQQKGSLELQCTFSEEAEKVLLDGDEYTLTKIAEMTGGEWVTEERFLSFACSWEGLSSSESHEKARQLAGIAAENRYYDRNGVTQNGALLFDEIDTGLYLVTRVNVDPKNADFRVDPFLVSIPQVVDEKTVYHVVVEPKFSHLTDGTSIDTEPSPSPGTPESSEPSATSPDPLFTGDSTRAAAVFWLLMAGAFLTAAILLFPGKRKRPDRRAKN